MKPKKAWRLINWAFKRMFIERSYRTFNNPIVQKAIKWAIEWQDKNDMLYRNNHIDIPAPGPMYMDVFDEQEPYRKTLIWNTMVYISDRWGCQGRLRFIQEVVKHDTQPSL